jgi:Cdc6-like AAA superfamily ATPase
MSDTSLPTKYQVTQVFKPGSPISEKSLFAGRTRQLSSLINVIGKAGMHAIIFGERGVGKTSLANVLCDFFEERVDDSGWLKLARVNCSTGDSYHSIWKKAFREITVAHERRSPGFTGDAGDFQATIEHLVTDDTGPDDIRYFLQHVEGIHLIIVDEFDRVADASAKGLMADTIKAVSDHSLHATLILVGVADSVDELIAEHMSIERSLVQVHMPRMSPREISEIVEKALSQVNMTIDHEATSMVIQYAQGLPHYAHLLGLHAAYAAISNGRSELVPDDVVSALSQAVVSAQQSIQRAYHTATSSARKTLFQEVLLACALAECDDLGYFAASDVRRPLSMIMRKRYDIPAFSRHLHEFCDSSRGPVLKKSGMPRRFRFRFINPLMEPFVVMKGLADGVISQSVLNKLISGTK